jgi:hypothetical protein
MMAALLLTLLASAGYAARDIHTMKHWHPMFVEPTLGYFGLSFFGHEHTNNEHPVEDGAFVRAPSTPTPTANTACRIIGTTGRPYG